MNRFILIFIILLLLSCGCRKEQKVEVEPELPNIVLLIGDDQGYPYFGFMGADYVQTPNMDALASSGTLFTNGYVPANHCRPSLQTLLTGTLPIQYEQAVNKWVQQKGIDTFKTERDFRFHAMKNFQTLPKMLKERGYASFQGGKWWEFNYQNGGFDDGMTTGWSKADEGKSDWFLKFMGGDGTRLARATMQPVYDFVEGNQETPFFIWFAPELPHYPFDAPEKYYNIYKDSNMTESAKRYYANCTWFDDGVGELTRFLKEKGEFDNTLFVYVNDNGWEQEPHQEFRHDSMRWHNGGDKGKIAVFDQSFRSPIIFSWKDKIASDSRKLELMHSADIPATILDYIGLDVPDDYYGKSYRSLIDGEGNAPRDQIMGRATQMRSEDDMMGMKIDALWSRTADWYFKWNRTTDVIGLYDMNTDPENNHNLAETNPELVAEFQKQLLAWHKSMR